MLPQYGTEHTVTVAHLEGGQAALEAAVGEAVGEQGEVSAGDALAADLLQLALLHHVPPRPDKLPVSLSVELAVSALSGTCPGK